MRVSNAIAATFLSVLLSACVSLVAPYDVTFDQSLNKFSEDTAKFTAAAKAGGKERSYASEEATTYYASAYNLLDRLSARAELSRGSLPCPTNETLKMFVAVPTSNSTLPEDYLKFDCREFQLFAVRLYTNQMEYAHRNDGMLNDAEADATGGILGASILGAIQTFITDKPSS
jgi:hypothetical protein